MATSRVLHRIGLNAPIARVYDALTIPEGISSWWTRTVKGTPQTGSEMEMPFKNDTLTMRFRIEELKWRVLAGPQEWIGSTIQFALSVKRG